MDGEGGDGASREAGNSLNQRGGEARMIVSHMGGTDFIMLSEIRSKVIDEVQVRFLRNILPRLTKSLPSWG